MHYFIFFWSSLPPSSTLFPYTTLFRSFRLERHYVNGNPQYGSWLLSFMVCWRDWRGPWFTFAFGTGAQDWDRDDEWWKTAGRSEEHTSELQSPYDLVCRLLLEK